jgi:hypothetical protein
MAKFLDDLKNAVEKGEFNSEAAKKIIEIDKLADIVASTGGAEANIDERLKVAGIKTVTEEEALKVNSEQEIKMEEIKKQDTINAQLATLIDIEDMVQLSIGDMMTFITELENKFEKDLAETKIKYTDEFKEKNSAIISLSQKIWEIKTKYNSIINK